MFLICTILFVAAAPVIAVDQPGTAAPAGSTTTPTADKDKTDSDKDAVGVSKVIRSIGGNTALPNYDAGHANQAYQPGASQLTSVVYFILDFFKYIFGGILTLMLVVSGIRLVVAARAVQDVMSREKETFRFALSGIIIILVADQFIRNVFFGEAGEVYRSGADMQMAAEEGISLGMGIAGLFRIFLPATAILFFVVAGIRVLLSGGDTEKVKKAKTQVTWATIGLVVAGLAEIAVFKIIFPDKGTRLPDTGEFARQMVTMTNWVSGFISTIAITMLIYAGYLYVTSLGGAGLDKAKTIVKGAIIGLLISLAAFGLVNTFVKLEPITSTPTPQEVEIPNR